MKSLILVSAAAVALLTVPAASHAQTSPGFFDPGDGTDPDPGKNWNSECNYNMVCDALMEKPGDEPADDTNGSSDDEKGWLDGIKDGLEGIGDWYKEDQAEKKAAKEAEIKRRQKEEEQRLADLYSKFKENPEMVEAILKYRNQENGLWQQTHRLLSSNRQFAFNGGGTNDDGALTYSGTFNKGYIYGSYALTDFEDDQTYAGSFAGVATRFGRVTGAYVTGSEKGNFTGSVSPELDKVFAGGFSCTQNCEADD